jgi:hypothetical protein
MQSNALEAKNDQKQVKASPFCLPRNFALSLRNVNTLKINTLARNLRSGSFMNELQQCIESFLQQTNCEKIFSLV